MRGACLRVRHFTASPAALLLHPSVVPDSGDISSTDGSMQLHNSSIGSSQQEPPVQHTVLIPDALQATAPGAPTAAWREEGATVRA